MEPVLTHKATAPVHGWGRGSGVFLACCEKFILPLKQCRGGDLIPQVKFLEVLSKGLGLKAILSRPIKGKAGRGPKRKSLDDDPARLPWQPKSYTYAQVSLMPVFGW